MTVCRGRKRIQLAVQPSSEPIREVKDKPKILFGSLFYSTGQFFWSISNEHVTVIRTTNLRFFKVLGTSFWRWAKRPRCLKILSMVQNFVELELENIFQPVPITILMAPFIWQVTNIQIKTLFFQIFHIFV